MAQFVGCLSDIHKVLVIPSVEHGISWTWPIMETGEYEFQVVDSNDLEGKALTGV